MRLSLMFFGFTVNSISKPTTFQNSVAGARLGQRPYAVAVKAAVADQLIEMRKEMKRMLQGMMRCVDDGAQEMQKYLGNAEESRQKLYEALLNAIITDGVSNLEELDIAY